MSPSADKPTPWRPSPSQREQACVTGPSEAESFLKGLGSSRPRSPSQGVKCLLPQDGLFWARAPWVKSTHCTNYFLREKKKKKKNRHHLPWIFTRSICLSGPCSPRRRSSESHGDWVAKTDLISFGALSTPLSAMEPSAHASKQPLVASQSHPLAVQQSLVPSRLPPVLGFQNYFLLKPRTQPCQLLAPGTSIHIAHPQWAPAAGSDGPVERRQRALFGRLPVCHWTEFTGDQGVGPRGRRGLFHFLLSW